MIREQGIDTKERIITNLSVIILVLLILFFFTWFSFFKLMSKRVLQWWYQEDVNNIVKDIQLQIEEITRNQQSIQEQLNYLPPSEGLRYRESQRRFEDSAAIR